MINGKLLKKSQFNYSVKDNNGNIILFNFAKGLSSFCKIPSSDVKAYNAMMCDDEIKYDCKKEYIVKLFQKGILVPKDIDELTTVDRLYYETAMNPKVKIIIMPTEQCNFRCKYCYESYKKGKMTEKDQIALLKFIQQKINSTNKLHISWFGGEPLEAVDVVYNIMSNVNNMVSKKMIQLVSDMTTNAYNLDAETFDKLYSLNVRTYQITLDGLEEQHNKQRVLKNGKGTFQRILDNLLYIKHNYEKYKFASISIRVNMGKEILEKLSEFMEFYRNNFGNDRRFSLALTPINDMGGDSVKQMQSQLIDSSQIYTALDNMNAYSDKTIQFNDILRMFSPADSLCYASKKNTYVIGSDLSIYKCTVHFEMEENNIGKILANGEANIDEFKDQKWYIKHTYKDICKSCFMLPCCYGGGCPHKRSFCEETLGKCVLPHRKDALINALHYYASRNNIDIVRIASL